MYVKPEIPGDEAHRLLSQRKAFLSKRYSRRSLLLKKIEKIYLPYYLFDVVVTGKSGDQKVTLAIDGLVGNTTFFDTDGLTYTEETDDPLCDFDLDQDEAQKMVAHHYGGMVLEQNARTREVSSIKEIIPLGKIFYPFWVGYFRKKGGYDFHAVDAVSGERQGVRMRKVFMHAFRHII